MAFIVCNNWVFCCRMIDCHCINTTIRWQTKILQKYQAVSNHIDTFNIIIIEKRENVTTVFAKRWTQHYECCSCIVRTLMENTIRYEYLNVCQFLSCCKLWIKLQYINTKKQDFQTKIYVYIRTNNFDIPMNINGLFS